MGIQAKLGRNMIRDKMHIMHEVCFGLMKCDKLVGILTEIKSGDSKHKHDILTRVQDTITFLKHFINEALVARET